MSDKVFCTDGMKDFYAIDVFAKNIVLKIIVLSCTKINDVAPTTYINEFLLATDKDLIILK
jgi:hypothetical protein